MKKSLLMKEFRKILILMKYWHIEHPYLWKKLRALPLVIPLKENLLKKVFCLFTVPVGSSSWSLLSLRFPLIPSRCFFSCSQVLAPFRISSPFSTTG